MKEMDKVVAEIRARNESLAAFASRIGVKSQDINNWKTRGIPRSKQKRVADALGWSLDRLLRDDYPRSDGHGLIDPSGSASVERKLHLVRDSVEDALGGQHKRFRSSEKAPGENVPGENVPGEQAPGGQAPGGQAPGGQAPAGQTLGEKGNLWIPKRRIACTDEDVVLLPEPAAPVGFSPNWLDSAGLSEDAVALCGVFDDSMVPFFRVGDLLLVDLGDQYAADGGTFVAWRRGALIIRRLFISYEGTWVLRAGDPRRYPDQQVPPQDQGTRLRLVGRVRWHGGPMV